MGYSSMKRIHFFMPSLFSVSCDCCGSRCREVKCPMVIIDGNFDGYVQHNSCLEKVSGNLQLKKATSTTIKYSSSFSRFQIFNMMTLYYMPLIRQKKQSLMCSTGTLFCLNEKHSGEYAFSQRFWDGGTPEGA